MSDLPLVSIVVTTYKESTKRYLDACIKSLHNLNYPKDRLDIVLVARPGYMPEYPGVRTIAPSQESFHNPVGLNYGFKHADPDSKYFLMLNDDCIATKDSLKNLIMMVGDMSIVVVPTTNTDLHYLYSLALGFMHGNQAMEITKRFYRFEEWEPYLDSMMNAESFYPPGLVVQRHLCFSAGLIPRTVWDRVGEWDEGYLTGQDDIDYCKRCTALKIPLAICLNSLIWHFGGVSSSTTMTDELRKQSIAHFREKWGEEPPT